MYCILGGIRLLDPKVSKVSRMESKKILEEESTIGGELESCSFIDNDSNSRQFET